METQRGPLWGWWSPKTALQGHGVEWPTSCTAALRDTEKNNNVCQVRKKRSVGVSKASRGRWQWGEARARQEGSSALEKGRRGLNLQGKSKVTKKAAKRRVPQSRWRRVAHSNVPKSQQREPCSKILDSVHLSLNTYHLQAPAGTLILIPVLWGRFAMLLSSPTNRAAARWEMRPDRRSLNCVLKKALGGVLIHFSQHQWGFCTFSSSMNMPYFLLCHTSTDWCIGSNCI